MDREYKPARSRPAGSGACPTYRTRSVLVQVTLLVALPALAAGDVLLAGFPDSKSPEWLAPFDTTGSTIAWSVPEFSVRVDKGALGHWQVPDRLPGGEAAARDQDPACLAEGIEERTAGNDPRKGASGSDRPRATAQMTCSLASASAGPNESVGLDVFLQDALNVRGYQTRIEIALTSGSGAISVTCPGGVQVDEGRADYVFTGQPDTTTAVNCPDLRASSTLQDISGVDVGSTPAYLSSYTLTVSADATDGSTFEITVLPYKAGSPGDGSILADPASGLIPFAVGPACQLTVTVPATSACCLPDGACLDTTEPDCLGSGGSPLGIGTSCFGDGNTNGIDEACEETPCQDSLPPPAAGWVDLTAAGLDIMPSAAVVGLDLDLDCVADTSVFVTGPVGVSRSDPVGGLIDTEIVSMSLSGLDVALTAGAGLGSVPLPPSPGAITEQSGDPALADSFFDVSFEVDLGGGQHLYNQVPVRVEVPGGIACVPPDAMFVFTPGCVPLYDAPSGGGSVIANLVTVWHDVFSPPRDCLIDGQWYDDGDANPAESCLECDPANSQSAWTPVANGTTCDTDACLVGETCQDGACTGGAAPDCSGTGDQCTADGTCDSAGSEGNCALPGVPINEGLPCSDEQACTEGETCQGGSCTGGSAVNCDAFDTVCADYECDPGGSEGNCADLTSINEGGSCDDGNPCNTGETCQGGVCAGGVPPDCSAAGDQCNDASCDPGGTEGNCAIQTPKINGTPCADGLYCTEFDTCQDGVCVAGGDPCTEVCEQCDDEADTCQWCIFDMDGSGAIASGDFNWFAFCYGSCYEAEDPCAVNNFDGDVEGCVASGDFSGFAFCYGAPCDACANCWPAWRGGARAPAGPEGGASLAVVAVRTPGLEDTADVLPASMGKVAVGQRFHLELWASRQSDWGAGLAAVHADLSYEPKLLTVEGVVVSDLFGLFTQEVIGPQDGTVPYLGGCAQLGEDTLGIDPAWVRVATLQVRARAVGVAAVNMGWAGERLGVSVLGEFGNLDASRIEYGRTRVEIREPVVNTTPEAIEQQVRGRSTQSTRRQSDNAAQPGASQSAPQPTGALVFRGLRQATKEEG